MTFHTRTHRWAEKWDRNGTYVQVKNYRKSRGNQGHVNNWWHKAFIMHIQQAKQLRDQGAKTGVRHLPVSTSSSWLSFHHILCLSICPSLASFILASLEAFHLWSILCNVHKCSSLRAQAERAFFIARSGSAETFHLWSMFACHQGLKLNTLTDWNNSSSLYIPHQYHLFGWIPLPVSKPYISHHRLYSRVHTQSHYLTTTA